MSPTPALALPATPLSPLPAPPDLLPFHIAYSGQAAVSTYFLPRPAPFDAHAPTTATSASRTDPLLLSTFRGRQVVGQRLAVPEGYAGVVLQIPAPSVGSSSGASASASSSRKAVLAPSDKLNRPDGPTLAPPSPTVAQERGLRRSPRKRPQPPPATAPLPAKRARAVRKFALEDSDSDDEDEGASTEAVLKAEDPPESASSAALLMPAMSLVPDEALAADADASEVPQDTGEMEMELAVPSATAEDASTNAPVAVGVIPPSSPPQPAEDAAMLPADSLEAPAGDDDDEDDAHLYLSSSPSATSPSALRLLTPSASFDALTLWTADDPVDEGRDEFYRLLGPGGWLAMSAVVHAEEEEEDADE